MFSKEQTSHDVDKKYAYSSPQCCFRPLGSCPPCTFLQGDYNQWWRDVPMMIPHSTSSFVLHPYHSTGQPHEKLTSPNFCTPAIWCKQHIPGENRVFVTAFAHELKLNQKRTPLLTSRQNDVTSFLRIFCPRLMPPWGFPAKSRSTCFWKPFCFFNFLWLHHRVEYGIVSDCEIWCSHGVEYRAKSIRCLLLTTSSTSPQYC